MVIDLLLLLCWAVIFWNYFKKQQSMKAYKEKYHSQTATRIKYDKRQVRKYSVGAVITGIIWAVSLVLMNKEVYWENSTFGIVLMVMALYGLLLGGLLFALFVYLLLAGIFYLKRLEKYGYEVPEDKRSYEGVLEQVPRYYVQGQNAYVMSGENSQVENLCPDLPKYNKISKCLMYICILASLLLLGWNFYFLYKWYFMGDDTIVLFVLLLIADLLWIFPIWFFRNQMNPRKFKDDVEIDAGRKERMDIISGLLLIVVLVGVALIIKNTAYNMSEYVFKSWMIEDQKKIGDIHSALEVFYLDPAVAANDENWEEIKCRLEEGVDITDWGAPEGEFQESLAKCLDIADFSQLKEAFYSTDGPAIVYVKQENGDFTVQLLNLYPAADREIIVK